MGKKSLFSDFEVPAKQDWEAKATTDLKGKPLEKLWWKSREGLLLNPYPFDSTEPSPWMRANAFNVMDNGWQTVQPVDVKNPAAKDIVAEALAHGIPAFLLYSAEEAELKDFQTIWDLIDLSRYAIHLVAPANLSAPVLAEGLIQKAIEAAQAQSLTGNIYTKPGASIPSISNKTPWFRTAGIDLAWLEARGATASTQLAVALSHTVDLLQGQKDATQFATRLAYRFGTGASFWVETAKYRAFRMLIARVLEVMGVEQDHALSPFILAETGLFNKSRYDARTNMLRATSEAISAAIGGAHAIVAWPHNRLIGESSVADARLGRNILQLMRYESYMHRVTDPAGGSRYVEQLTSQLANEGWRQFQEIESFGGYAESSDWLDKKMGEAMAGQHQDGATRKRSYVGVNNYPNPAEGLGPTIPDNDLRPIAAYERLRAAVEKLPDSPEAFIFMFGNRTMRNARNTFARNVIGILGLNATENKQADDWEASIEELKQRNPALICLCAADEDYSLLKTDELRRIMPKALIVVAGKEQAGLTADFFVYRGADILGVLTRLVAAVQD